MLYKEKFSHTLLGFSLDEISAMHLLIINALSKELFLIFFKNNSIPLPIPHDVIPIS
jgi:hypothetical protein